FLDESRRYEPSNDFRQHARIKSKEDYERLYRQSLEAPDAFWKEQTEDLVFRTPWNKTLEWTLPHSKWFVGATLNITESCLDRHLKTATRDKVAIVWEGEPEGKPGESRTLTYGELHAQVVALAAALKRLGVKKGDRVTIYMGM